MIDNFSISDVNSSCTIRSKPDLHMVDLFATAVKVFFKLCQDTSKPSNLLGKAYDLKSAYRQVPVRSDHLKFAYFSIYNCEKDCVEIYRLPTLPFGATHSVFSFLRLAKSLHTLATRALLLITTHFYDDYILASEPHLTESAQNSLELVFLLTGWNFARDGKKQTEFDIVCKALGVAFDFQSSGERVLLLCNTKSRIADLVEMLNAVVSSRKLDRHDALRLRGRQGFADSFLHGRLGALVLKRIVEHAYSGNVTVDDDFAHALVCMRDRLQLGKPKIVDAKQRPQWFVFSDASYDQLKMTGGLGAVLIDSNGRCVSWFSFDVCQEFCAGLGACDKDTIIYELELAAAVISMRFWSPRIRDAMPVLIVDNEAVRFSLIRGVGNGSVANKLIQIQLESEIKENLNTWFARVGTEANIADYPSRFADHPLLSGKNNERIIASNLCREVLHNTCSSVSCNKRGRRGKREPFPLCEKDE